MTEGTIVNRFCIGSLCLFLLITCHNVRGQKTFNVLVKDSTHDYCVKDVIETNEGHFILAAIKDIYNADASTAELIELSDEGKVLKRKEMRFEGMPSGFISVCQYSDNEFLLGGFTRTGVSTNIWLCVIDTAFNVKQNKSVPINGYNLFYGRVLRDHIGNFFCFGTLEDTTSYKQDYAFLYQLSPGFDSMKLKVYSEHWAWGMDLIERNDQKGFYFVGVGFASTGEAGKLVTIDRDLNISRINSLQEDFENMSNVKYMDDRHLVVTGERRYSYPLNDPRDIGVLKYDTMFNLVHSVAYGKIDTEDGPSFIKNIAVQSTKSIFIGGTANLCFSAFYANQPSWFMLNNTDTSLSPKWQKFFGGDGYCTLWGIIPTKDSGCLMYGTFWDYQHIAEYVNYISVIKVNKDGLLLGIDGEPSSLMKDVIIYPNPGSDRIWVITQLPETSIEFYDITGKTVLKRPLMPGRTQIETSELSRGMYIYRVFNKTRQIQTGKWIKN